MKKFLAVLLCGCLMMGVAAGCGTEQAETETEEETADVRKIDGYYPFSTIHYMEGVDDVEEAPASLYSGTHEDLEGTPYKFIGEVTGVKTIDEIDDETPMPCFFVRTENGDVLVTNGAYILAKDVKDLEDFDDENFFDFFTEMPKVGEYVCVYADYKGYNEMSNFIVASYNPDCMVKAMAYCYKTDGDNSDTANTVEKGEEFSFSAGNYYVGEDIPAGRYDVKWVSGIGNCITNGMIETFADSDSAIQSYSNLDLEKGEKIQVSGSLTIKFTAK